MAIGRFAVRLLWAGALPVALGALAGSASAATLNVTGTWQAVYHCESGSCAGALRSGTFTLAQAAGSSAVSGTLNVAEGGEGSLSGSLTGNTLALEGSGKNGYTASGSETISADGLSWTGSYKDNHGTSGTLTATRPPSTSPTTGTRPSAIEVLCNLQVAPATFTCTAQVGDASGQTPTVPSGTVKFSAPTGTFTPLETCTLAPTPSSGSVASCSVTYVPPTGGIPTGTPAPVTGTYSGDSTFAASSALSGAGAEVTPTVSAVGSAPEAATTTVSCPAGAQGCPVTANLSVVQQGQAVSAKAKRRTVTIGATAVTLKAGQKRTITVKLNSAGKRLLATHKHLTALLKVTSGGKLIKSQKVQIKPAHKGGGGM